MSGTAALGVHNTSTEGGLLTQPAVRRGVAGAVLTLVCLCSIGVLATPAFLPSDESAHVGYALDIADGRLPTVLDRVEPQLAGQRVTRQYTANHPPLYHAIAAPVLSLGVASGHERTGFWSTRFLSVVFAAMNVVVIALVAGVVGRRRQLEAIVLAAGLAATIPTFVATSSVIYNDALALLGTSLAILGAALALTQGPRAASIALVCVGAVVGMATRFSSVGVVLLTGAALAVAFLIHLPAPPARRALRAAGGLALPLICVAVTSGWFYLRNRHLYGDLTGVAFKSARGARADAFSFWDYVSSPTRVLDLLVRSEGGGGYWHQPYFGRWDAELLAAAAGVVALGGLLLVVGRVRRRGSPGVGDGTSRPPVVRLAVAGLMIAVPLLMWVQLAGYVDQTGGPAARYTFAAIPVVVTSVAYACLAYPGRLGSIVGVAIVGLQVGLTLTTGARFIDGRSRLPVDGSPLYILREALAAAGLPVPTAVLGALVTGAIVGLGLQLWALLALNRASTVSAPTTDERSEAVDRGVVAVSSGR